MAWILAAAVGALLIRAAAGYAFHRRALRAADERWRILQMRGIVTLAVQLVAAMGVLVMASGPPRRLSTIIGLATTGLTVAQRDLIFAFIPRGRDGVEVHERYVTRAARRYAVKSRLFEESVKLVHPGRSPAAAPARES